MFRVVLAHSHFVVLAVAVIANKHTYTREVFWLFLTNYYICWLFKKAKQNYFLKISLDIRVKDLALFHDPHILYSSVAFASTAPYGDSQNPGHSVSSPVTLAPSLTRLGWV